MKDDDPVATDKLKAIQKYVSTSGIPQVALLKMAKLGAIVDDWMKSADVQISAVQCWTSLEENLGVVPCTVMSMMSDTLLSSACEVDVCGGARDARIATCLGNAQRIARLEQTTTAPIPTKPSASTAAICRSTSSRT